MAEVSRQAREIHDGAIVIDGCSFFFTGRSDRIRSAGTTAINFTVPLPMDDFAMAVWRIKEYYAVVEGDPESEFVLTVDDLKRIKREGRFGVIIGCQNARIVGTDLATLLVFHRLGLRVMQLTYNERNHVADGCMEPNDAGVSHFGRRLIKEANRLGIVVDLSHGSRRTCLDAIEASEKPCIISHAGLRRFIDSPRCVPVEVVKALGESGGVIGVTSHPNMNWRGTTERPSLSDFLDNVEFAIETAGIDHVGIGTDHVVNPNGYPQWVKDYLRDTYAPYQTGQEEQQKKLAAALAGHDPREEQLEGFGGMQDLPLLTQGLLDRGYSPEDIRKVLGGNFLRVFSEVWRPS